MAELLLNRYYMGNDCTWGALITPHDLFCYTIERPWLDNKRNVSCIPAGRYAVERYSSPKFMDAFHITNVADRSAILFHPANFAEDLEGCIAPGEWPAMMKNKRGEFRRAVTKSADTLCRLIQKYPDGFLLTINNGG